MRFQNRWLAFLDLCACNFPSTALRAGSGQIPKLTLFGRDDKELDSCSFDHAQDRFRRNDKGPHGLKSILQNRVIARGKTKQQNVQRAVHEPPLRE
ncbi:MAG: hypothetical protein FVQ84_17680 [Planctomycetes bacterium]|nr:hypothetical protein [Planctomycetota bacterium]